MSPLSSAFSQSIPFPNRSFGNLLDEGGEVVVLLDVLPLGVAPVAPFQVFLGVFRRARLEDLPVPVGHLAVVAGAAVVPLHVVRRLDPRGVGLHREPDVHVAQAAGVLGPVEPVVELDRGKPAPRREVLDDDPPVFIGQRASFFGACLGVNKRCDQWDKENDREPFFHAWVPPPGTILPRSYNASRRMGQGKTERQIAGRSRRGGSCARLPVWRRDCSGGSDIVKNLFIALREVST